MIMMLILCRCCPYIGFTTRVVWACWAGLRFPNFGCAWCFHSLLPNSLMFLYVFVAYCYLDPQKNTTWQLRRWHGEQSQIFPRNPLRPDEYLLQVRCHGFVGCHPHIHLDVFNAGQRLSPKISLLDSGFIRSGISIPRANLERSCAQK